MQISRRTHSVPWRAPLRTADAGDGAVIPGEATVAPRELVVVELRDENGAIGLGESAHLPGYLGSSADLADQAGLDVAGWDLRARRAGVPLWSLLGASRELALAVNATIGAEAPLEAAAQAAAAVRDGFGVVKVKAGDRDDLERVRAVRTAIGPHTRLRIDANGAWDVEQACARLGELADVGLELCEEPVHGAGALAEVARRMPQLTVAADESATEVLDLDASRRGRGGPLCAAVCLKVARGGITTLLADAARARGAGYEVYLASTLDGPLGIAAALHVAAAIVPDRACGLATLERFARPSPIAVSGGRMSPPPGPGLGDGLLDWYER